MSKPQRTKAQEALAAILEDQTFFNVAVNDVLISAADLKSTIKRIYDIAQRAQ